MIKCDEGTVTLFGDKGTVMAELSCMFREMKKVGISKEDIEWAIGKSFEGEKELDEEIENTVQTLKAQRSTLKSLLELLESIEGEHEEKHSDKL